MSMQHRTYNTQMNIETIVKRARNIYKIGLDPSAGVIDNLENTINQRFTPADLQFAVSKNLISKPANSSRYYILLQ